MTDPAPSITGGVDTHKDLHVAAALDDVGRLLGTRSFPTTAAGFRDLLAWLRSFGDVAAVGIEGTGSWGAGLTRHLLSEDVTVLEVNRPNRQDRRRRGKSDPADAEAAARAVLAEQAIGIPKLSTGVIEAIRLLRVARRGAVKARTQVVVLGQAGEEGQLVGEGAAGGAGGHGAAIRTSRRGSTAPDQGDSLRLTQPWVCLHNASMRNVLVRDLPDDVHAELQRRALQHGKSLQQYLTEELTRLTARPPLADVLARISSRRGGRVGLDQAVGDISAERDRR